MSLYHRLDLSRPSRKFKVPIWERLNLDRHVFIDEQPVDYLGIASFSHGKVTGCAAVRIDQILNASSSLNLNQ